MDKKSNKTVMIRFRVSPSQKETMMRHAEACNLGLSDYLRIISLQGIKVQISMPEADRIILKTPIVERLGDEASSKRLRDATG